MKFLRRIIIVLVALVIIAFGYYRLWFLRLPNRAIPNNPHLFVSPGNGTIVSITHWNTDSLLVRKEEHGAISVWTKDVDTAGTIVSIQLNIANVHYQRAPVAGKIISEKYVHGSFHNAITMSNEYGIRFENEHNEFLMESPAGSKYKVIQIAGLMARRIVSYKNPGDGVKQGDVLGLIKLGSQVTVIFPHDVTVTAKMEEVVVDGETMIAIDK